MLVQIPPLRHGLFQQSSYVRKHPVPQLTGHVSAAETPAAFTCDPHRPRWAAKTEHPRLYVSLQLLSPLTVLEELSLLLPELPFVFTGHSRDCHLGGVEGVDDPTEIRPRPHRPEGLV